MTGYGPIILIMLIMMLVMGGITLRRVLHPYLGRYDIALILDPMKDTQIDKTKKGKEKALITIGGAHYFMAGRKEFDPMVEDFRVGKKADAFTYRRDNSKVAFVQGTHRVFFHRKNESFPMAIGWGLPARSTSAKGMDMFVAQELWKQGIAALRSATNAPLAMMIMAAVLGFAAAAAIFFAFHPGYVPVGTYPSGATSTSTVVAVMRVVI